MPFFGSGTLLSNQFEIADRVSETGINPPLQCRCKLKSLHRGHHILLFYKRSTERETLINSPTEIRFSKLMVIF